MEEFAKKKGKVGTRGAKQIAKENSETIHFYRNLILGANGVYFSGMMLLGAEYHAVELAMFAICALIYIGGYQAFSRFGAPTLSEKGEVLDSGLDLNMKEGLSEHVKDLLLLTVFCQMFSLVSNYVWLFLLAAPTYALWKAWSQIIAPWIFAPPDEDPSIDEKKQKKLDRKARRMR